MKEQEPVNFDDQNLEAIRGRLRDMIAQYASASGQELTSMGAGYFALLVSGDPPNVNNWGYACGAEYFDSRPGTWRYRLYYSLQDSADLVVLEEAYRRAVQFDVTVQMLCSWKPEKEVADEIFDLGAGASASVQQMREEYPIVYLASHQKKWKEMEK